MAKVHPLLLPIDPSQWDWYKAAHLLARGGFGGTLAEIDRAAKEGLDATLARMFDFPDAPADEQSPTDQPDLSSIDGLPRSEKAMRELFAGKSEEERKVLRQQMNAAQREALVQMARWWMQRMIDGPHPLQEKLTLLWHGHFTTSAKDERSAWLMWRQNELLRRQAAGNFETFVRQISRDPAMLDYLNNQQNRKRSPNENYARELMELFTLGIGQYSERDIKESARAFTGWGHDGERFVFRANDHDNNPKTFFGQTANLDGDDIISLIFHHPRSAEYVAGRLWSWLAYETDDPALLRSLGEVFRSSRFELRPLLRQIFASQGFYSPAAIGTQIKSPVQLIVGSARLLDVPLPPTGPLRNMLEQMGQVPFFPPNVKGWPGGRAWINTSTLFVRYNTGTWLSGGGAPTGEVRPGIRKLSGDRAMKAVAVETGRDVGVIVDHWVRRLIQRPVAAAKREILIQSLNNRPDREENIRRMIQLILSMPEYQLT